MDLYLKPELTCKLCLETFASAQVLRCGHCVCAKCRSQLITPDNEIECHECQTVSSLSTVPNVHVDSLCSRYEWWKVALKETRSKLELVGDLSRRMKDCMLRLDDLRESEPA